MSWRGGGGDLIDIFHLGVTIETSCLLGPGLQEQGIKMNYSYAPNPIEDASKHKPRIQTWDLHLPNP